MNSNLEELYLLSRKQLSVAGGCLKSSSACTYSAFQSAAGSFGMQAWTLYTWTEQLPLKSCLASARTQDKDTSKGYSYSFLDQPRKYRNPLKELSSAFRSRKVIHCVLTRRMMKYDSCWCQYGRFLS